MPRSTPYRVLAVVLLCAIPVVDIFTKLGKLGHFSALLYIAINVLLLVGAFTAIAMGERRDRAARANDVEEDY